METRTIIEGTHRPEDLIVAFVAELRHRDYQRAQYAILQLGYREMYQHVHRGEDLPVAVIPNAHEFVDYLATHLNEVAPEGYYFGTHPGNGSDFGFWPVEILD